MQTCLMGTIKDLGLMTSLERQVMYTIIHLQSLGKQGKIPRAVFQEVDAIAYRLIPGSDVGPDLPRIRQLSGLYIPDDDRAHNQYLLTA
jgi:hypothetical protein